MLRVTFTIAIILYCLGHDSYTDMVNLHIALLPDAVYHAITRLRTSFGRTARTWRLFNLVRNPLNGDIEVGDVDISVAAVGELGVTGRFDEEAWGFLKFGAGLLDRVALTGDVQVRAAGDIVVVFALDDGCDPLRELHSGLLC